MLQRKPIKINHPGIVLRKKSSIHQKIIDKKTGRRKVDVQKEISENIELKRDQWYHNGNEYELRWHKKYITKDINQFSNKKQMDTLVIGPGEGAEVVFLKEQLSKVKNNIDTIGLINYMSEETNNLTRKDYSPKKVTEKDVFEHFNHLEMVNKYDYIFSASGPMLHTNHPELVLLKSASMLHKGGLARIEIDPTDFDKTIANITKYLKIKGLNKDIKLEKDNKYILIHRLK
jgi:hypothetical protein